MSEEPAEPATGTEGQPPPATPQAPPEPEPEPEPAGQEKPTETVEFWKEKAREQEKRAKANAKAQTELEKLRKQTMSETEKAVAEAEARGRQAATADVGQRLAAAEIKAALTGVVSEPEDIIDDLNLTKFLTEDGSVDSDAVKKLRKKYEAMAPKEAKPAQQRPKEGLRSVPIGVNGEPDKTDMNEWMRKKASS